MITHLKIYKTESQLKGSYTVQKTDKVLKLIRKIAVSMRDSGANSVVIFCDDLFG